MDASKKRIFNALMDIFDWFLKGRLSLEKFSYVVNKTELSSVQLQVFEQLSLYNRFFSLVEGVYRESGQEILGPK